MKKSRSPKILTLSWGKMEIESLGVGKDFKLWPGGGRPWDWGETGTGHTAGIQIADVDELIDHGCRTVVLACGVFSRLTVSSGVVDHLETHGIEAVVTDTKRGVRIYNDCAERGIAVGGLFHSTC